LSQEKSEREHRRREFGHLRIKRSREASSRRRDLREYRVSKRKGVSHPKPDIDRLWEFGGRTEVLMRGAE